MHLEGFGIGNYRSFRAHQRIGPLSKVNLFVGGNNTGKSNILRFLRDHLSDSLGAIYENRELRLDPKLDVPLNATEPFTFSLAFPPGETSHLEDESIADLGPTGRHIIAELLNQDVLKHGTNHLWIDFVMSATGTGNLRLNLPTEDLQPAIAWHALAQALATRYHDDLQNIVVVYKSIIPKVPIKQPYFVPAIREVRTGQLTHADFSGAGLIERLAQLRDPRFGDEHDEERFAAITRFIREVLGSDSTELRIPWDQKSILVRMDGKTLPLESLGTGVHEVVILAAAGTVLDDEIVCIEEPEIHLHPLLQRKLLTYLAHNTTNQYFIASHSAHLIDTPDATVFRVRLEDYSTRVTLALHAHERFAICQDLGYRASDLLQTNAIIWVEGPSEVIYLNHWISSIRPDLVEGLHYSIMWYGGRLLSHLSTEDEVGEFIELRRLNQNVVVVMDSDKATRQARLSETKRRIQREFSTGRRGFAWVTKGREIENYIVPEVLIDVLRSINPKYASNAGAGRYDRAIPQQSDYRYVKVRVARKVAQQPADLSILDLRLQVRRLVEFIDAANQDPVSGQRT
jgi:hypothetical protein